MPRAYYKPFTAYEEVVGFRNIKHITKGILAVLFAGLFLKMYLFSNFSACVGYEDRTYSNPEYMERLNDRMEFAQKLQSKEEMRKALVRRLPPA